jgi:hypothetical protein
VHDATAADAFEFASANGAIVDICKFIVTNREMVLHITPAPLQQTYSSPHQVRTCRGTFTPHQ